MLTRIRVIILLITLLVGLAARLVYAGQFNDPTKPLLDYDELQHDVQSELIVRMIKRGKKNYALINQQYVQEGDKLNNYTVIKITHDAVQLSDGKKQLLLPLLNQVVKKERGKKRD